MTLIKAPDLEGCRKKFGRGKTHAEELRSKVGEALGDGTYPIRTERDEDAREYIFYVEKLPASDPIWSLIFGDAVHNFRAALDHLVAQLAVLGQGRPLTEEQISTTKFPVFKDKGWWKDPKGPKAVRLLRSDDRARIWELQPFNATNRSIWGSHALITAGARIPRLIQVLHDVDIADKHRFIHPSWLAVGDVSSPPVDWINVAMARGQGLEADPEVGRWSAAPRITGQLPQLPADLDVSRYFPLDIDFGGPFGYSMLDFIDEVESLVGRVIDLFVPALTKGDSTPPVTALL